MKKLGALVGLFALSAGCISIGTYESQMKLCRETSDHARHLERDLTAARAHSTELEAMVAEQELERQALKVELSQVRGTYDELIQELKDDIARGEVAVKETPDGLVITLDNQILFQSGRAELQKPGRRVLLQVADVLRHVQGHAIQIQGHTDNVPIARVLKSKFTSNWDLSAARAAAVLRFLQEAGNVDPARMVLQAYADQKPIADNSTPQGRHQNRRVDIVLVAQE